MFHKRRLGRNLTAILNYILVSYREDKYTAKGQKTTVKSYTKEKPNWR